MANSQNTIKEYLQDNTVLECICNKVRKSKS